MAESKLVKGELITGFLLCDRNMLFLASVATGVLKISSKNTTKESKDWRTWWWWWSAML
jgi:hypothetical protein